MTRRRLPLESAKSALRVAVAHALATAAATGFDNAQEEGRPLTQLQQIDVLEMHMHAYHEAVERAETEMATEAILFAHFGSRERPA